MTFGWDDDPQSLGAARHSDTRRTAVLLTAAGLALLALLGGGLLLLSSGGGGGSDTVAGPTPSKLGPSSTAGPTTAVPPAPPPAASPPPPAPAPAVPPPLGDIPASRTDIGYLRSAQTIGGVVYLGVDRVQFLTGTAARKAAAAAGQKPADTFIVNSSPQLRYVKLAPNVTVSGSAQLNGFAVPGGPNPTADAPRTVDELGRFIAARGPADTTPFRLSFDPSGAVATVKEQHRP
ncbi:MAG: hypothetical protein JWL64_1360 [Frankiales bacterium]|nr:hypothetical protein [Frankiales bacterium]